VDKIKNFPLKKIKENFKEVIRDNKKKEANSSYCSIHIDLLDAKIKNKIKGKRCFCGKKAYFIGLEGKKKYFCKEHFIEYFERKVKRIIEKYKLFNKNEKILVAISGGKDSVVAFYVLKKLGYNVKGFHINLGIGNYSKKSLEVIKKLAKIVNEEIYVINLKDLVGKTIGDLINNPTKRPACSYCGITKRYLMNRFAYEFNFDCLTTGHHLDDELNFFCHNLVNWNLEYLIKQEPKQEKEGKFVKKVKVLYECEEKEIKAYADALNLPYYKGCCELADNQKTKKYNFFWEKLQEDNYQVKIQFIRGFLRNKKNFCLSQENKNLKECKICGFPTNREICSFCAIWDKKITKEDLEKNILTLK
jgi:uncharacterized protein (TIGR00269 family)